ncbi:calcium/sodium antiporter [Falsiroseomonas oryziterrae]|uniref:calcium/sodium antiporter n=1 Tax=Falsiroseomonas oryziterrae TaxID=2911368 RepID=UPI001F0059FE|nr:calcium/sodium antiporter [Roseomonas sp. NPKOSM-4]
MEIALLIIGGLVLLAAGGELLVRGAVRLAERMGVSPLLIGLTLVGFGTSMPELVTSVQAALVGSPGIAVGNVVGSNIANILLILGLAALISPVAVGSNALRRDGLLVVGVAVLLTAIAFLLPIDRIVGLLFLAGLAGYILYAWKHEQGAADGHTAAYEKAEAFEATHPGLHAAPGQGAGAVLLALGFCVAGLALVILGGRFLVDGAVQMARSFGISETVIGLTIVAVGTSMPELVTSLIAAARRQSDVALGNILGSNIYNVLGILGVAGLISPVVVPPEIARFDNFVMVAVSLAMFAFAWTGMRIGRREGGALLAGYVTYVWWIWPSA